MPRMVDKTDEVLIVCRCEKGYRLALDKVGVCHICGARWQYDPILDIGSWYGYREGAVCWDVGETLCPSA